MKRFSKVRYNQDKHCLRFKDRESIKSFNLNDIDDLKELELFLNRVDIGEAQSTSDYLKSFEGKRYYIDSDEECHYIFDKKCRMFYLFVMDDVGEAIQAVYLLNKQYDFILDLIKFMESKGFTNDDFEKFIEKINKKENSIVLDNSENIDDLYLKYIESLKNKRFYCKYNEGHYYILDRKQNLPSIYTNTIDNAIYIVNYLNK